MLLVSCEGMKFDAKRNTGEDIDREAKEHILNIHYDSIATILIGFIFFQLLFEGDIKKKNYIFFYNIVR